MAIFTLTDCLVLHGGTSMTGDSTTLSGDRGADIHDITPMGATSRTKKGALRQSSWSVSGHFNNANWSGPHGSVAAAAAPMTVVPAGNTAGNDAMLVETVVGLYKIGAAVGEVLPFEFTAEGLDPMVGGYLFEQTTKSAAATTYTAGVELGALTAGHIICAAAHVTAIAGTLPTIDFTIQSDADNNWASPEDRQALTQMVAVGGQWKEYSTAQTDTWWRFKVVVDGTTPVISYTVSMGLI